MLIYEFNHRYIKKKYDEKTMLLFADAGSLIYHFKTKYFNEEFRKIKEKFYLRDYSDYSKCACIMTIAIRKSRKFKDGAAGVLINEFFGLKSKMYSFLKNKIVDGNPVTGDEKTKGIEKEILKKELTHEQYEKSLHGNKQALFFYLFIIISCLFFFSKTIKQYINLKLTKEHLIN